MTALDSRLQLPPPPPVTRIGFCRPTGRTRTPEEHAVDPLGLVSVEVVEEQEQPARAVVLQLFVGRPEQVVRQVDQPVGEVAELLPGLDGMRRGGLDPRRELGEELAEPERESSPELTARLGGDLRFGLAQVFLDDLREPGDHAPDLVRRERLPRVLHRPLDRHGGEQVEVGEFQFDEAEVGIDLDVGREEPGAVGPLLEREQLRRLAGASMAAEALALELPRRRTAESCRFRGSIPSPWRSAWRSA